jgi:3D (Asp-Asp-Asp) domain-containing protein
MTWFDTIIEYAVIGAFLLFILCLLAWSLGPHRRHLILLAAVCLAPKSEAADIRLSPRQLSASPALRWTAGQRHHPLRLSAHRSHVSHPSHRSIPALQSVRAGSTLTVLATGYSKHEGRIGGGPRNCLGEPLDDSTIAVDPRVIPIGSIVRIGGRTYRARDVGGAIVGKRIDLHFSSARAANRYRTTLTIHIVSVGTHRYNAWYARKFGGRHHSQG